MNDKGVAEQVKQHIEGLREQHGVHRDGARQFERQTYETTMRTLERRDRRR